MHAIKLALAALMLFCTTAFGQPVKLFQYAAGDDTRWTKVMENLSSQGYYKGGLVDGDVLPKTAVTIARERSLIPSTEPDSVAISKWLKANNMSLGEKIPGNSFRNNALTGQYKLYFDEVVASGLTSQAMARSLEAELQQLRADMAKFAGTRTQLLAAEKRLEELQTQLTALERGGATVAQLDGLKKQVTDLGRNLTVAEKSLRTDGAQLQERVTAVESSWWGRFGPWFSLLILVLMLAAFAVCALLFRRVRAESNQGLRELNNKIANSLVHIQSVRSAEQAAKIAAEAALAAKAAAAEATDIATMARGAALAAQREAENATFMSNSVAAELAELKHVVPMAVPPDAVDATPPAPAPSGLAPDWAVKTGSFVPATNPADLRPADGGIVVVADGRPTDSAPLAASAAAPASGTPVDGIPGFLRKDVVSDAARDPVVA